MQETGWYDGERFVKPPEVLARDRLLGTYEVSPVMKRLRRTMLAAGGSLLVAAVLLTGAVRNSADADGMYGRGASAVRPTAITSNGIIYSKGIKDLAKLAEDDDAAAQEQAAMKGTPGYCGDRCAHLHFLLFQAIAKCPGLNRMYVSVHDLVLHGQMYVVHVLRLPPSIWH